MSMIIFQQWTIYLARINKPQDSSSAQARAWMASRFFAPLNSMANSRILTKNLSQFSDQTKTMNHTNHNSGACSFLPRPHQDFYDIRHFYTFKLNSKSQHFDSESIQGWWQYLHNHKPPESSTVLGDNKDSGSQNLDYESIQRQWQYLSYDLDVKPQSGHQNTLHH